MISPISRDPAELATTVIHIALPQAESVPQHVEYRPQDRRNVDIEIIDLNLGKGGDLPSQGSRLNRSHTVGSVPIDNSFRATQGEEYVNG